MIVLMVIFGSLGVQRMKAELKFATLTSGEQYAGLHYIIIAGVYMKLKWCVISLDIHDQVYYSHMHA